MREVRGWDSYMRGGREGGEGRGRRREVGKGMVRGEGEEVGGEWVRRYLYIGRALGQSWKGM